MNITLNKKFKIRLKKNPLNKITIFNIILKNFLKSGKNWKLKKTFSSLFKISKIINYDLINKLFFSIELIKLNAGLKPIIASGKKYQVPSTLNWFQKYKTGFKNFSTSIKNREEKNLSMKILFELFDTLIFQKSTGLKKQTETYQAIVSNRALIHFSKK